MKLLHILVFLLASQVLMGQQLPLFTQYSEYQAIINPATINYDYYQDGYDVSFGASYRDQWTSVPDRPRTFAVRAEKVYTQRRGASLVYGGYVIHDQVGPFSTTGITGRVASMFRFSGNSYDEGAFSVGLNFGINQYRTDLAEFYGATLDPALFSATVAKFFPDVGIGASIYRQLGNDDFFSFGVSIPQVFGLNLTFRNDDRDFDVSRIQHFYTNGSYYLVLGDDKYMEFSGWVKKVNNVPLNVDVNYRFKFAPNMWFGVGYNSSRFVHTEVGVMVKNWNEDRRIKVGYAYNPSLQTYGISFGSTHELNISYLLITD